MGARARNYVLALALPRGLDEAWLAAFLESPPFLETMQKIPQWHAGDELTLFPEGAPT